MLHFLQCLGTIAAKDAQGVQARTLALPWLALIALGLALPWLLLTPVTGLDVAAALAPAALWKASWPILLGGLAFLALRRLSLPSVPEGDIVVCAERTAPRLATVGVLAERLELGLASWPVAGRALLLLALGLAAAFAIES